MSKDHHLEHLKHSLPKDVVTYQTSFYTVALEGWRRGLKLNFYNNKRGSVPPLAYQYSLSDGENEYLFTCARGSKTSDKAIDLAENKSTAYKYMKRNNVPVPENKTFTFSKTSIEKMCKHGEKIGYPLVVKPTDRGSGKGVYTNITSRKRLEECISKIRDEFKAKEVIIEQYFAGGVDYRFYVIKDEVIAVTKSYSSNVIGDGVNNIEDLISERNKDIRKNVATKNRSIVIDNDLKRFLEEQHKSLEFIPENGERVFVRRHGTHLGDRLNVDCTQSVDPKFKKYAIKALNAIPGLPTGSIDMVINEEKNEGIVNEINTKGEIMMHVFPFEGRAIDVPKHLLDFYFPNSDSRNEKFYFEFKPIKDLLFNGYADQISIPMIPKEIQYQKNFTIKGKHLGPRYLRLLKKQAVKLYLIGSINPVSKKWLEIKAIGSQEKINQFEKVINTLGTKKSKTEDVTATQFEEFEGNSNISFEIISDV
ncbi:hypothetical protein HUG15_00235 [Salicibibacter cibarius]|uniref:Acylphosphatase n=1 Tax=Salicibibacter cibarius TaxID=2743000 RepID=A0A7T6YZM2_9BACI|nr:hypothetical protein [Salicibibacter cibarius]QQK74197.1 hypothetical protein HUG15_00235 [Salicibibacter cibarius]